MNCSSRKDSAARNTRVSTKIKLNVSFIEIKTFITIFYSAICSLNILIRKQLTDMLLFNQSEPLDLEVREPSVEPCWIDSLDESRSSFFAVIERMHAWFEFMADQIIRLKSLANVSAFEISRYGNTKHFSI